MTLPGATTPRRKPAPLVAAVIVGVLLIVGVRACTSGGGTTAGPAGPAGSPGPGATSADPGDEGCTVLALTASSEKAALLGAVAKDYADSGRQMQGSCVRVRVSTKASGGAEQSLARGWDERVDGPRPDVWSPASRSWTVLLQGDLAARDRPALVPTGALPSIARTPLVLAMPRPMAEALGWPDKPIGWSDLLALSKDKTGWQKYGHPEWGSFRLGKTNPQLSTSGLNATIGTYLAATGRSSDLKESDLKRADVLDFQRAVEAAVVHYGDTTLTFLSNLQRADDAGRGLTYISAVAVEEKSVWDYNQGNPTGDPATLGRHPKPKVPLVAVYPREGTLFSDNPYTVLTADWVDDAKRAAAADFLAYLQAPAAQARFSAAAFRDAQGGTGGGLLTREQGLLADQPAITLDPPAPAVLAGVQRSWLATRKRARVLLVIDVSGSMGNEVDGSGGRTRLELAQEAASRSLDLFQPDDLVGIETFTTDDQGRTALITPLAPIAPVGPARPALKEKIAALQPLGGTPLYAVARQAVALLEKDYDPTRINAVVLLTDGRNEFPGDTDLSGLLRDLGEGSETAPVRVFTVGYSEGADQPVLARIAEASRAAAYDASDAASIDKVLTNVVSNF